MLSENDQKKSASYAIEMMLKLSNCFEQMSTICRTAVVQFTKDLHLKQDYERISKYRISDEPKRQLITQPINSKIQEQMEIVEQIFKHQIKPQIEEKRITRKSNPKRIIQTETIIVAPKQKKDSESPKIIQKIKQKQQNRSNKVQPIVQKIQQKVQSQKTQIASRQRRKPGFKISPRPITSAISDSSSQPSDYKSRKRNKKSQRKSRSKENNNVSKPKRNLDPSKKRPLNGFMNFFKEVKDQIKLKYNVYKVPQISHYASVEWKKLPAQEQQKYCKIYYQNMKKMKMTEDKIQLEEKTENKESKKEDRTYLKVRRPPKEKVEQDQHEQQGSGEQQSSSGESGSNDENSESLSPQQSSQVKKKGKQPVTTENKENNGGKQIKIQLGKQ